MNKLLDSENLLRVANYLAVKQKFINICDLPYLDLFLCEQSSTISYLSIYSDSVLLLLSSVYLL